MLFFGSFLRRHEFSRLSGATYLLLGCMITSLLYKKPIMVAACSYIIIGDTFAAIIGQNIKSLKIFRKTLLGSLAFLASAAFAALIWYRLGINLSLMHLLMGAVAATIIEL